MNRSICIKCKKHMHKYLLLSASRGSVPGKVIVIVDGELTSYFLWGFLHTFIFTKAKNTVFARIETKGWSWLGKKLEKKQCVVYRALDMTTMNVYITCTYVYYSVLYNLLNGNYMTSYTFVHFLRICNELHELEGCQNYFNVVSFS